MQSFCPTPRWGYNFLYIWLGTYGLRGFLLRGRSHMDFLTYSSAAFLSLSKIPRHIVIYATLLIVGWAKLWRCFRGDQPAGYYGYSRVFLLVFLASWYTALAVSIWVTYRALSLSNVFREPLAYNISLVTRRRNGIHVSRCWTGQGGSCVSYRIWHCMAGLDSFRD